MQCKQNVNDVLGPALLGKDVTDQQGLDDLMIKLDGTHNKVKTH
jgi:enolase